jgi:hypothetical protein
MPKFIAIFSLLGVENMNLSYIYECVCLACDVVSAAGLGEIKATQIG